LIYFSQQRKLRIKRACTCWHLPRAVARQKRNTWD